MLKITAPHKTGTPFTFGFSGYLQRLYCDNNLSKENLLQLSIRQEKSSLWWGKVDYVLVIYLPITKLSKGYGLSLRKSLHPENQIPLDFLCASRDSWYHVWRNRLYLIWRTMQPMPTVTSNYVLFIMFLFLTT